MITETVDAGLLGECIIPTLRHAWSKLLLPPSSGGHVIPAGATVYAAIVECESIRHQSRFVILITIEVIVCIISNTRLIAPNIGGCIDVGNIRLLGTSKQDGSNNLVEEPYTCERLQGVKKGYKALSSYIPVMKFDFSNPMVNDEIFNDKGLCIFICIDPSSF